MNQSTNENFITDYFCDNYFKKAILLVVVLLAVFLAVKSIGVVKGFKYIGGGMPITNTITVTGEGEIFAIPDIATFTFSVLEEGDSVKDAQTVASRKTNDMIAYLKREGVGEKDIKTLAYSVNPRYEYGEGVGKYPIQKRKRTLVGYEVRQSISVKVRVLQKAGELLSWIGGRGVSNISGLQFTIGNEEVLRMDARRKAIKNAKDKATQLSKDLGVELVRIISFSESKRGGYSKYGIKRSFEETPPLSFPQIPAGENKILSDVSVTYEIQ